MLDLPPSAPRSTTRRRTAALLALAALTVLPACKRTRAAPTSSTSSLASEHPEEKSARGLTRPDPLDDDAVARALSTVGAEGWIHGAVAERGLYVFTLRDSADFFRYRDFPLIPATSELAQTMASLRRHDRVLVRGVVVVHNEERHLRATAVELVEKWSPSQSAPPYRHDPALPERLLNGRELAGRVHAVDAGGRVLVLEYGDLVVPIAVEDPTRTAELWRNDKVRVRYRVAGHPGRPTHLRLDPDADPPIERLSHIAAGHGAEIELEGELTLFPKSPQLLFDIWALRVVDADQIECDYTLVNFEDLELFSGIRAALAAAWQASAVAPVDRRNKLTKPGLRVRAKGILNVVSPGQANPQILLRSREDVTILPD